MTQRDGRPAEMQTAVVRFRDNEIVEGSIGQLDLDSPDFELAIPDGVSNNRTVVVPLNSVKLLLLRRRRYRADPDGVKLRKTALRFWDGEVLKGFLATEPERHVHAMCLELVSPALDEAEMLAVPYSAVKGLFFLKMWDGRAPAYESQQHHWALSRGDPPLLDLLGEIHSLSCMRVRGQITEAEFARRRRAVLERI